MQLNINWRLSSAGPMPEYVSSSQRMQLLLQSKLPMKMNMDATAWFEVFLRVDAALRLGIDVYGYACRRDGRRYWLYQAVATEGDEVLQVFNNPIEAMEDRLSLVPDASDLWRSFQFQRFSSFPNMMYRRWWSAMHQEHQAAKKADSRLEFRLDAPRALFQRIIDRAKAASATQIQQYKADRASGNDAC